MINIRQTPPYAKYLKKIGWTVKESNGIYYFIKKIPLIGSVLKVQRPRQIYLSRIKKLQKKYRTFQTIIEPRDELGAKYLTSIDFRKSKSPYIPTKTLLLNLTQSENKILKQMKKDARRAILKNKKTKVYEYNEKVPEFRNAWKKTVSFNHYVPPQKHIQALEKSFKNNCFLSVCLNNSKEVSAGAIFLLSSKIGYYWQAFTNQEGRNKLMQYKIVWKGILWAKRKGAEIFNFEGIYDPEFPNKKWLGFTHFKRSFGGYEIEHPGSFIKTRIPI